MYYGFCLLQMKGSEVPYQNIVLNSSRTNVDSDRDLGGNAPWSHMFCRDPFPPYKKPKSMGTPIELITRTSTL